MQCSTEAREPSPLRAHVSEGRASELPHRLSVVCAQIPRRALELLGAEVRESEASSVRRAPRDESVSDYRFTRSRADRPSPRPIAPFTAEPEMAVPPDWLIRSGAKGNQRNFPTACTCWQAAGLLPAAAWAKRRWNMGKGGVLRAKIHSNWFFVEIMQITKACLECSFGELISSEREGAHWLALLGN